MDRIQLNRLFDLVETGVASMEWDGHTLTIKMPPNADQWGQETAISRQAQEHVTFLSEVEACAYLKCTRRTLSEFERKCYLVTEKYYSKQQLDNVKQETERK